MHRVEAAVAEGRYLNFGAGDPAPNWVNVDSSPMYLLPRGVHRLLTVAGISPRSRGFLLAAYRYARFTRGRQLPFSEGFFHAVYCSHVLEHLPAEDVPALLDEFHRLLSPKGLVRITVPDLEAAAAKVIAGDSPWVSIEACLGTIPPELARSRMRAALEGLFGFPSLHRTLVLREALLRGVGDRWKVRIGLRFMESEIEPDLLRHVEREDRCRDALVFELRRSP